MDSVESGSFNSLVESFLGTPLPGRLADKHSYSALSTEARAFILRMLALMKRALFPAAEFNSHMINLLFVVNIGPLWEQTGHLPVLPFMIGKAIMLASIAKDNFYIFSPGRNLCTITPALR